MWMKWNVNARTEPKTHKATTQTIGRGKLNLKTINQTRIKHYMQSKIKIFPQSSASVTMRKHGKKWKWMGKNDNAEI